MNFISNVSKAVTRKQAKSNNAQSNSNSYVALRNISEYDAKDETDELPEPRLQARITQKQKYFVSCLCFVFILFLLCDSYWHVVLNHGTFLPPFVQLRTKLFPHKIPKVPKNFEFKHRIVVSFTTMPHHMGM